MISRPTTDQLIADVCQDLVDAVLPALTDETLQVIANDSLDGDIPAPATADVAARGGHGPFR